MTGFSPLPVGQEEGHDGQAQKFRGVAKVLGPRWAHLPSMTIGLLGVQIFWSVEMSYGVFQFISTCCRSYYSYSFTVSAFTWIIKIEYGYSLRCWAFVGSHHAATRR